MGVFVDRAPQLELNNITTIDDKNRNNYGNDHNNNHLSY